MNKYRELSFVPLSLTLALVTVGGCVPAVDVVIHHPLITQKIDPNSVVKEHGYAERSRGLPPGALSDAAALTRVGTQDVCFDVTLHELDPIDLKMVRAKLMVPGQVAREQAQLWPEQPVARDYQGLVPNRVQTGYINYCAARAFNGVCIAWNARPTYGVVMTPGAVPVYETRGRMCFPNGAFVSPETQVVSLELVVPRPAKSFETAYTGYWAWGAGDKRTVFRWGFEGALEKKKK